MSALSPISQRKETVQVLIQGAHFFTAAKPRRIQGRRAGLAADIGARVEA